VSIRQFQDHHSGTNDNRAAGKPQTDWREMSKSGSEFDLNYLFKRKAR
jgi:hypothetical protein